MTEYLAIKSNLFFVSSDIKILKCKAIHAICKKCSTIQKIKDKKYNKNITKIYENYDGFKKNKTKIKNNVFIGSNTSIVAPVTINEKSVVGAGSVITKNVKKESLAITRSSQVEIKNYKRKK